MKGVILAAGDGGRLQPLTLEFPKVLLEVGGIPLIHYSINALVAAGVSDIVVVTGYQSKNVMEALQEIYPYLTFVYNEDHAEGNALSVYAAREFVSDDDFVLCMGDHPINADIVDHLLSRKLEHCVLCVDLEAWHPSQLNDATRVLVHPSGSILEIGKHLKVWNAIDTGVFRLAGDVFPVIEHLVENRGAGVSITEMVNHLGAGGHPFSTCDVSGMFWADVDTLEDYRSVDELLRDLYGERV